VFTNVNAVKLVQAAMEGTGESIEKWEVDEMMHDGDKNQDGMLDYEGRIFDYCSNVGNIALPPDNFSSERFN